MDFWSLAARCLRQYATFRGRAGRREFWVFALLVLLGSLASALLDALINRGWPVVGSLFGVATLMPLWAVTVRRLHDRDRGGGWLLLPALVGGCGALIFGALPRADSSEIGMTITGIGVLGSFGVLLVWLALPGVAGPIRFMGDPDRPDFWAAVRTCLHNYGRFSGRARRAEYWFFVLFATLVGIEAMILDIALFATPFPEWSLFSWLSWLATLLPTFAAGVRRLHDRDYRGWWLGVSYGLAYTSWGLAAWYETGPAMGMMPFAACVATAVAFIATQVLILLRQIRRGTPGPNRFGEDPLAAAPGSGL